MTLLLIGKIMSEDNLLRELGERTPHTFEPAKYDLFCKKCGGCFLDDIHYWGRCRHCREVDVGMVKIDYPATVRHGGRLHSFTVFDLEIPICQGCDEKVFTESVDAQINDALHMHLLMCLST